jgi:hypothetical protein
MRDDDPGVELAQPDHLAAVEQRRVDGHEQAVHMEDGQCVDQHVALSPSPVVLEHDRVGQQVAVRQHGALAAARGAAGVEDGSQVVVVLAPERLVPVAAVGAARSSRLPVRSSPSVNTWRVPAVKAILLTQPKFPGCTPPRRARHCR